MNNPISAGIGKYSAKFNDDAAFELLRDAGIPYVDYWLALHCSNPENAPMRQDDWKAWVYSVKEKIDSYGLKVGQCHAHWRFKTEINEDFSYKKPWELLYRNFEACHILGTKELVFHPQERWMSVDCPETLNKVIEANAAFFSSMVEEAEKWDVYIDVENLFDHKHKCAPASPAFPFGSAEHLLKLYDLIGSDRIGFCLDTGHANIAGQNVTETVKALGPHLRALHLNDNYGLIGPIYEDLHLFPGYGKIEWQPFFKALKETGYTGTLNMEVISEFSRYPKEQAVIMLRAAREMLEYMRDNYTED